MKEHWSLIVNDTDRVKREQFENGEFVSATYERLISRMETYCGLALHDENQAFDALRKLRNKYVHFFCQDPRPHVVSVQLTAWHHVFQQLESGRWGSLTRKQRSLIETARAGMNRSEEFLEIRFTESEAQLEAERASGRLIGICPLCRKHSLIIAPGELRCQVCGPDMLNPERIAEQYCIHHNAFWKHPKHGPGDEIIWCPHCELKCIIEVQQDLAADVRRVGLARHDKAGHGPSAYDYCLLCLSCSEVFQLGDIDQCGQCGEAIIRGASVLCPVCTILS